MTSPTVAPIHRNNVNCHNKRLSYEARSPEDKENNEDRRPLTSKVQRTNSHNHHDLSWTDYSRVADEFTILFGFGPNEFLPLDKISSQNLPLTIDTQALTSAVCDDALSECLFSGFLDTVETVRLASLSKRFAALASACVARLDFSRCRQLSVDDIHMVVRRFPNLKELDFDYCTQFGCSHVQALLPLACTLEKISLRGCCLDGAHLASFIETLARRNTSSDRGCYTKLSYVDVSAIDSAGSTRVGDETMEAIAKYCPHIETFKAAWCRSITDEGLKCFTSGPGLKLQCLEELDLSLTSLTDQSILLLQQVLHSSQRLIRLDVSATRISCSALMDMTTTYLERTPLALQELNLQFLEDLNVSTLRRFLASSKTSKLVKLDLSWAIPADEQTTPETVEAAIYEVLCPRTSLPLEER